MQKIPGLNGAKWLGLVRPTLGHLWRDDMQCTEDIYAGFQRLRSCKREAYFYVMRLDGTKRYLCRQHAKIRRSWGKPTFNLDGTEWTKE